MSISVHIVNAPHSGPELVVGCDPGSWERSLLAGVRPIPVGRHDDVNCVGGALQRRVGDRDTSLLDVLYFLANAQQSGAEAVQLGLILRLRGLNLNTNGGIIFQRARREPRHRHKYVTLQDLTSP